MMGEPDRQIYCYGKTTCCSSWCEHPLFYLIQPAHSLPPTKGWHVGRDIVHRDITQRFRWQCPKIQWSGWGREEAHTSWPRCSSSSQGGQARSPVCMDSWVAAAVAVAAAVSGSPGRGAACARSFPAWCCRHKPRAWVASEVKGSRGHRSGQTECDR